MKHLTGLLVAMLAWQAAVAQGDNNADLQGLAGTWIATKAELGGQPFPEEFRQAMRLTLNGETYLALVGDSADKGTFKINAGKNPKTIDITGKEGPNKDLTIPAIYQLFGDTLIVCYDISGKDRPKLFETTGGPQHFLVHYKRVRQ